MCHQVMGSSNHTRFRQISEGQGNKMLFASAHLASFR